MLNTSRLIVTWPILQRVAPQYDTVGGAVADRRQLVF